MRRISPLPPTIGLGVPDLQNRQGRAAHGWVGSTPTPLHLMARHLLAAALVVLVLAGCGGSSSSESQGDKAVAARWASGLHSWGSAMNHSIDGISLLFSRPADVRGIQAGNHRVGVLLTRYTQALAGCSARVERLGVAPATLSLARGEALHACIRARSGPAEQHERTACGGRGRCPSRRTRRLAGLGPNSPIG
jgi:hypothetical protein